ncbi:hypothetical protein ABZW10_32965 [Kitasatospora sp. NPDC004723]|uniref:hypothetical protein n=1 Tax=Kitasatospora sp. NPDC004723 TaxID=3154288 RepID=UPI0033A4CD1A
MTAHRRPRIGGPLLDRVAARCERRCACTGRCGNRHTASGGRCEREHRAGRPLIAAPADPSMPDAEAARLPVEQLLAWCGDCLAKAAGRGRADRAHRDAEHDAEQQFGLF